MIDKRLGKSKKYASLKSDRSRVLYVLMYAHADCEGKIDGDPEEIKMECCPRLPYSIKEIASSVIELDDVDLIDLYEVDENPYIKFKRFDDFQIGIRKDREAKSIIPESIRSNSGVTPSLYLRLSLRVKEVKEVKKEVYFLEEEGIFINISEEHKTRWKEAYPACDIELELKQMGEWLLSNPSKRKSNYIRFITNWFKRTQDSGGTKGIKQEGLDGWAERSIAKERKEKDK